MAVPVPKIIAPPIPWVNRKAISIGAEVARAQRRAEPV